MRNLREKLKDRAPILAAVLILLIPDLPDHRQEKPCDPVLC